ncbi:hypothetical protein GCM10020358_00440 [Amorphoplanes nipponensis]
MVMALRGDDFLEDAIGRIAGDTVAVTLAESAAGAGTPIGRRLPDAAIDGSRPARTVPIAVPQGAWRATIAPTVQVTPDAALHLDLIAALVGAALTALLAALTGTVITSRNRALRRIDAATIALRDDISRREVVEQQLRRREEELVGFAGVVAHDLRSPLARITGYADFLARGGRAPAGAGAPRVLERLHGGAQRMQSLIDDLLTYATADNRTLVRTRVDLNALAAEVIRDRVTGPGEREPAIVMWPLPVVDGDPVLLRQVFDHLVGNALKYTATGQTPAGDLRGRDAGTAGASSSPTVGSGIPAAQRATVFHAVHPGRRQPELCRHRARAGHRAPHHRAARRRGRGRGEPRRRQPVLVHPARRRAGRALPGRGARGAADA